MEGPIQYVGPDTYILLDATGRPQPMLGMKYDDFMAVWKKSQNLQAQNAEPRFVIESIRIDGEVRGEHAELAGAIVVRQLVDEQVAVPLGLAGAILREQPKFETAGDKDSPAPTGRQDESSFVDYDRDSGGFIAQLRGHKGDRCEISLPILVPLVRDGKQTSLRLNLPKSAVGHLSLDVGTTMGGATVSSGSILTKETTAHGGTRLTLVGLASEFQLTWSAVEQQRAELTTVLSAVGNEQVSIDGHSIRSDTRLTVRSYGASFDRLRVRLPPGAQLIQERRTDATAPPANYRVTLSSEAADDDAPPENGSGEQIAAIEFAEMQSGPVDIDLSTEQPLGETGNDNKMELAGFEVLGAVRQYGRVAVHVADNWQLRWDTIGNVCQVERAEQPANLQQPLPTATFEYGRQPWSLHARLEPRPLRVHVTPDYNLELGPDKAQLHVRLNYQLPGARAFEFRIQLRGWELTPDPVESGGLVDQDRIVVSREGILILPLGQASSRRAEVTFSLRRSVPRDVTRLELPLPMPEADSVGAADLVVRTAADIDLMPELARANGMSATPVTTDTPLPTFDDGRQEFRFRAILPDASFAATRTIRKREITCEASTQMVVDRNEIRATQTIDTLVRYQPLGQLTLDVPEQWSIADDHIEIVPLESEFSGPGEDSERQPSTAEAAPTNQGILVPVPNEGVATDHGTRTIVVSLPQPRLGRFAVRVRYAAALPDGGVGTNGLLLPLPEPMDGPISKHELSIGSAPELSVRFNPDAMDSPWQAVDMPPRSRSHNRVLDLVATVPHAKLPLSIRPMKLDGPQPAIVDRVWLETWLAGNIIQDRAAFRFTSTGSGVTIELPPQAQAQEVEALLDGRTADVSARIEGRLVIAVPVAEPSNDSRPKPHTLELRYRHPTSSNVIVHEQLTPPQLVGTSPLSQTYWQLVLPTDEQLVESPAQLVPLDQWQWLETFWGRRPTKSQTDLEAWVGATNQLPPSASQNEYLFGGFLAAASIEIVIVPRWLIVLAASGAVLAVVVGWIYVPRARRAWFGIALAVVVATLTIAYPAPAALLGEASLLGIVAAAIAAALHRRLGRPAPRTVVGVGSTNLRVRASTRVESAVTPPLSAATPLPSSASATPALPVHVQDSN